MSNIVADWCDESDCRRTLRRVYDDHGYCVDPHTAVAVNVAERKRTSLDVPVRIFTPGWKLDVSIETGNSPQEYSLFEQMRRVFETNPRPIAWPTNAITITLWS